MLVNLFQGETRRANADVISQKPRGLRKNLRETPSRHRRGVGKPPSDAITLPGNWEIINQRIIGDR
jgi:hypothetical protein